MIIGTGDIAKVLNDREGALFFACGVSNSGCEDMNEFYREVLNLSQVNPNPCLFYFSSISIYTSNSLYAIHKRTMEQMIRRNFANYNIIRLGNIDFGTNPNTFLNNLRGKKERGEPYEIRDEYKFMVSKEQLLLITDNLPLTGQNEISIFGEMKKVKDLI